MVYERSREQLERVVTLRISDSMYQQILRLSEEGRRTVSQQMRYLVELGLRSLLHVEEGKQ